MLGKNVNNEVTIADLYKTYVFINLNKNKMDEKSFRQCFLKSTNLFFFSKCNKVGYLLARIIDIDIEIIEFKVQRNSRRKGVGAHLLKQLIRKGRILKKEKIFLEVSVENFPAINLYKKLGFKKIGKRKNYYNIKGETKDAFLMQFILLKRLSN
tara:strand:+ start:1460 stop:1921 length:462 start_codon:yes stop_codon:yes gene_type:complete